MSVLLVTPNRGFGELISKTLRETGGYEVYFFTTGVDALEHAQTQHLDLGVLDTGLVDLPILELWRALQSSLPDMKLIVIPTAEGLDPALQAALKPDALLSSAVSMPELLATVTGALESEEAKGVGTPPARGVRESSGVPEAAPPWLQDVHRAARHLAQLSLESAAQAALITRKDQVWAYAGELPQPAIDELAGAVADYWDRDGRSDLARFMRLDATGGEYMLYATALAGELVLSLLFEASTPFSKIRAQAGNLARALARHPGEESAPVYAPAQDGLPGQTPGVTAASQELGPFLEEVPSPSPPGKPQEPDTAHPLESIRESSLFSQLVGVFLEESDAQPDRIQQDAPVEPELPDPVPPPTGETGDLTSSSLEIEPIDWEPGYPAGDQTVKRRPEISEAVSTLTPELSSPFLHRLSVTCLLIPRMPAHELTHDLTDLLTRWVPQICLAYGWRLERLVIRPAYLLWVAATLPEASPLAVIDAVRQATSERIFDEFSRLKRENPSGDFWAPGYLVLSGAQVMDESQIVDFIRRTRTWQGAAGRN